MTHQPEFVTFTGIDDRTDLTAADELARQYPIEWGVLFTQSNRDARFPCAQAVAGAPRPRTSAAPFLPLSRAATHRKGYRYRGLTGCR